MRLLNGQSLLYFGLAIMVWAAGCRAPSPSLRARAETSAPAPDRAPPQRTVPAADGLPAPTALEAPTTHNASTVRPVSWTSTVMREQSTTMTLEDAVATALEQNPTLVMARAAEPVAHAAYHVAETYPWNPQFQTQVFPYSRDRDGNDGAISQQHVIVQTFELGGQRYFRRGAAAANWAQVQATIQQSELTVIAQTTRLYLTALYARDQLAISQSLAQLNEQLVGVIERRLKAGQAKYADLQLAKLQAHSALRQQRLAQASFQTALANLRNYLNLAPETPIALAGQLTHFHWTPPDELPPGPATPSSTETALGTRDGEQARSWAAVRPDVVAARAAVAAAAENVRLADAMRRPDLQIGPMWQRDDASTEFWGFQAQMDIPVVNTGKTLVAQRVAELQQRQIVADQLERQAELQVQAALQRYRRAWRLAEDSRPNVVVNLSEALKPFDDQFRAGQINLLEVYAARSTIVQSQQSYLDLLNEVATAAADVLQQTGLPLQQLLTELPSAEEVPAP